MAGRLYEKDTTGRSVVLTNVRFSFGETLQEAKPPRKDPTGRKTHGCNLILERGSKDFESNKLAIVAALQAAAKEFGRPENWWKTLMDDSPKECSFRKGERFKDKDSNVYKGYAENLIVVCKGPMGGADRPRIKDRMKRDVAVEDINTVVYNGTYGDCILSFYGTDNGGTPRLTCSINAIRSYQEGERLGGGAIYVSDDDFDGFDNLEDDSFSPSKPAGSSSALDL
jgi:hypothetical protein